MFPRLISIVIPVPRHGNPVTRNSSFLDPPSPPNAYPAQYGDCLDARSQFHLKFTRRSRYAPSGSFPIPPMFRPSDDGASLDSTRFIAGYVKTIHRIVFSNTGFALRTPKPHRSFGCLRSKPEDNTLIEEIGMSKEGGIPVFTGMTKQGGKNNK